jgi:hypothetical protein
MTGIIFLTFIHSQQSTAAENVQAAYTACVASQGQWHIPRNAEDRGFDSYLSISGGGGDTGTDSPVPIWTKSDV